jgi:hypothetical protein
MTRDPNRLGPIFLNDSPRAFVTINGPNQISAIEYSLEDDDDMMVERDPPHMIADKIGNVPTRTRRGIKTIPEHSFTANPSTHAGFTHHLPQREALATWRKPVV